ncbi:uncharacterized protein CCOS01_09640 [Colletotrichum costaricense]|uniref:Uncharacterized protein n=2 Tax=Colletotrichum acutatum species complex TaxID=2707335 RepID=A0AAI9YSA3_9PEZI|nr:uncharacterized protein CCOS01_09640 [Colletotrichum costaricense]XP_060386129.1 uncharacterized protein CTAM01_03092 [Colletotrichum tamarilloi]KAK1506760.1 hypothetical protein CTAM01_03092 [Colletotrichum tamarilloi]KAK1521928.1 hypothetical protein CCOS01_09640 [Colletotrichum costaricense]
MSHSLRHPSPSLLGPRRSLRRHCGWTGKESKPDEKRVSNRRCCVCCSMREKLPELPPHLFPQHFPAASCHFANLATVSLTME